MAHCCASRAARHGWVPIWLTAAAAATPDLGGRMIDLSVDLPYSHKEWICKTLSSGILHACAGSGSKKLVQVATRRLHAFYNCRCTELHL